jgi:hypothetical protein
MTLRMHCGLLVLAGTSAVLGACGTTAQFSGVASATTVSGVGTASPQTLEVAGDKYGVEAITVAEGGVNGGLDQGRHDLGACGHRCALRWREL